jgi:N-acetylglutamate synthase-like GNAT family acetyltransferase
VKKIVVNCEKHILNMNYWPVNNQQDLEDLKAFLKESSLPADDIRLEGNQFAIYRDSTGKIVGTGGLEFYGDYCLLRSVAVAPELRGTGIGKEIVTDLITRAKDKSVWSVSLLTETAQPFFERLGFENVSREKAAKEIQSSSEFSTVCPVSAAFMSLNIKSIL